MAASNKSLPHLRKITAEGPRLRFRLYIYILIIIIIVPSVMVSSLSAVLARLRTSSAPGLTVRLLYLCLYSINASSTRAHPRPYSPLQAWTPKGLSTWEC